MHVVKWIGFGLSSAVTKTVVHFFPSAGNVTAPYPAQCRLSVYGKDLDRRSVVLDGARFSQPDGVKLDAAFPVLQEGISGPIGIELEITSSQPRLDLEGSFCIIEFVSAAPPVRYLPKQVFPNEDKEPRTWRIGLMTRDAFSSTSLVVVNATSDLFTPKVAATDALPQLVSHSAHEIDFSEGYLKNVEPTECSWGLARARGIEVLNEESPETAFYMLYRDSATRRTISVCAL